MQELHMAEVAQVSGGKETKPTDNGDGTLSCPIGTFPAQKPDGTVVCTSP
jgi:hypothetical protein